VSTPRITSDKICQAGGFSYAEQQEVTTIYKKDFFEIEAPEGYEFTGEFRRAKALDYILWGDGSVVEWLVSSTIGKYLILQPITVPISAAKPTGLTAKEVIEKFGTDLLSVHYKDLSRIVDFPGFVYTGSMCRVSPQVWYLDPWCDVVRQSSTTHGLYLTLEKTDDAPRIVTFLKTERSELGPGEAGYALLENGGLTPDTSDSQFVYTREETA
jgi:hypothetical protein